MGSHSLKPVSVHDSHYKNNFKEVSLEVFSPSGARLTFIRSQFGLKLKSQKLNGQMETWANNPEKQALPDLIVIGTQKNCMYNVYCIASFFYSVFLRA